jgi:3'-phosphoadenosine 5'-phosphosulfate sulfotransferase (PAPS reductase)/FAD synthetase
MKVSPQELQIRLAWPLDMKLEWFCRIYSQFMIATKGNAYQSFSGGKDSDTARSIIENIHNGIFKHITPNWERIVKLGIPPLVFSNTGLEFPEVVEHVRNYTHTQIKPKMGFTRVIAEIGVAVISKEVAQKLREIRTTKSDKLRQIRLYGSVEKGHGKLPIKYRPLIDAPFKISEKCCDVLKKEPFRRYEKETGRFPIVFTTVKESRLREASYLQTGCNSFEEGKERCRPLSIFVEKDIWEYASRFNLRFAEVYYERNVSVEQNDGSFQNVKIAAETQTGCMFCMFGLHLEDKTKNNRIQRIAIIHPKLHDVIINKCGLGIVLDYLKLPYIPMMAVDCSNKGGN